MARPTPETDAQWAKALSPKNNLQKLTMKPGDYDFQATPMGQAALAISAKREANRTSTSNPEDQP